MTAINPALNTSALPEEGARWSASAGINGPGLRRYHTAASEDSLAKEIGVLTCSVPSSPPRSPQILGHLVAQVLNGLRELAGAITSGNLTSITFGYSGHDHSSLTRRSANGL
jgi:hypothetical protein